MLKLVKFDGGPKVSRVLGFAIVKMMFMSRLQKFQDIVYGDDVEASNLTNFNIIIN
jgi:hypothetical protein